MRDPEDVMPDETAGAITRRVFFSRMRKVSAMVALGSVLPAGFVQRASASESASIPGKELLIVRSPRPLNLETPASLFNRWITPNHLHFVRNHAPVPKIALADFRLKIDGEVDRPSALSFEDLMQLPQVTQVCTLECAGNGRAFYNPKTRGNQWEKGAVGTARYVGVRVKDVLAGAGVKATAQHMMMDGDDIPPTPTAPDFIRSVPIEKALHPDTLLVHTMNGAPLPPMHGYPLRSLVPGWVGSASVKWLTHLSLMSTPFPGKYMTKSYRLPNLPIAPGTAVEPKDMSVITELEVKSMVIYPTANATLRAGAVQVRGAAWAGEVDIATVDVSTDLGRTWHTADLGSETSPYAWRLWSFQWTPPRSGSYLVMSRATDSRGRIQPIAQSWNPKGYQWNVIDMVRVNVS